MIDLRHITVELTKRLVCSPSIVQTAGEKETAIRIYEILQEIEYFQEHADDVKLIPTQNDDPERYSVVALLRGAKDSTKKTILLMGHFDTVGVEDYGKWVEKAFSPEELLKEWKENLIPDSVQEDISQGKWLPGRGILDMKSGLASHIALLQYFSEHRDELEGNLLFVATCDEENSSQGILSTIEELLALRNKEKLHYIAAINSDYTAPRYAGDPNRYVYLGTVGKLLPTVLVVGRETHVGQAFEGFDPNLVISELTRLMDYNPDLCDELYGEVTLPPVSLKQTDLKKQYDVQTPHLAYAYYNFFLHRQSPKDVLEKCKEIAKQAFAQAIRIHQHRHEQYGQRAKNPYQVNQWKPLVYTYDEFYRLCKEKHGAAVDEFLQRKKEELAQESLDIREYSLAVVKELWQWSRETDPMIILFYGHPYIPKVILDEENQSHHHLIQVVQQCVDEMQAHLQQPIQVRKFYPYISDMSYVCLSDSEAEMQAFEANMPVWDVRPIYDSQTIRELNVPVMNIGPYGKDAHKQWERVDLDFSMEVVPKLTYQVIRRLLVSEK